MNSKLKKILPLLGAATLGGVAGYQVRNNNVSAIDERLNNVLSDVNTNFTEPELVFSKDFLSNRFSPEVLLASAAKEGKSLSEYVDENPYKIFSEDFIRNNSDLLNYGSFVDYILDHSIERKESTMNTELGRKLVGYALGAKKIAQKKSASAERKNAALNAFTELGMAMVNAPKAAFVTVDPTLYAKAASNGDKKSAAALGAKLAQLLSKKQAAKMPSLNNILALLSMGGLGAALSGDSGQIINDYWKEKGNEIGELAETTSDDVQQMLGNLYAAEKAQPDDASVEEILASFEKPEMNIMDGDSADYLSSLAE